jgi:hypothetical protein
MWRFYNFKKWFRLKKSYTRSLIFVLGNMVYRYLLNNYEEDYVPY